MNIGYDAILLSGKFSGVHNYIYHLSRALAEEGDEHDFSVFLPRGFSKKRYSDCENIRPVKALISGRIRLGRILWEQVWFPFKSLKYGFDLMHFPGYIHPFIRGIPTVLTVHDLNAIIAPELCKKANVSYFSRFLPRSVEWATRIITPTERVKDDIFRILKKPKACIDVIPLGTGLRPPAEPSEHIREKYSIGNSPYILFVGNMDPKKGLSYLIKGFFAAITYRKLDYNLVIAGERSWNYKKIRRLVSEFGSGFSSSVVFTGYAHPEDLGALYSQASLLVSPSLVEGFGLPPLEAMACRTPVLLSSEPALKENYEGYAHFFRTADLRDLREKLELLLTDEQKRIQYTEKAEAYAHSLNWKHTARLTLQTYERAVRESSR